LHLCRCHSLPALLGKSLCALLVYAARTVLTGTHFSGCPSSAHYFIAAQGSFLFYLDPHHTRPALPYHEDPKNYTAEEVDSCHTRRLRRIHVREMDPSMLIGFLIKSEDDWADWRRSVKHVQGKSIIHVSDFDPSLVGSAGPEGREGAIDEVEFLSSDDDDMAID
jgi:cysteine protease ATG4